MKPSQYTAMAQAFTARYGNLVRTMEPDAIYDLIAEGLRAMEPAEMAALARSSLLTLFFMLGAEDPVGVGHEMAALIVSASERANHVCALCQAYLLATSAQQRGPDWLEAVLSGMREGPVEAHADGRVTPIKMGK